MPTAADVAARNWPKVYQGKILRVNLDGSIPADNPMIGGVRSHIYSYGHRNPQGLTFAPDGSLYESEHGPSMDDEVNRIEAGKNYGWPYVAGRQDDRVYVYANWSKAGAAALRVPDVGCDRRAAVRPPTERDGLEQSGFRPAHPNVLHCDPGYNFSDVNATIAPSGTLVYSVANGVPGWANSVLVTSLLRGVVYRLKLNAAGTAVTGDPSRTSGPGDRFRDLAFSQDGKTIYVVTDPNSHQHAGAILAFTYQP